MATTTLSHQGGNDSSSVDPGLRIMQKMGYTSGSGLGKNKQGIRQAIDVLPNLGRHGLGLELSWENWDFSKDDIEVQEKVIWLVSENKSFQESTLNSWLKHGRSNHNIDSTFCDPQILADVFDAKTIFDEMDLLELCKARAKSNPFETIKSVFFINRSALKMANIDAATDFMFTKMEYNKDFKDEQGPIYFADLCAGPGGFTEYVLWRKNWLYKGFGMTLKDDNDFRLCESNCASSATFQALYGKNDDGDICNPDNITDFEERVRQESGGGVHFVMSDGGFSVEGNEAMQEILSKNIYICQCIVALKILKPNGHFITKLFDIFTLFSVGLLYLMHLCFEKVSILKPKSSRPANSERYLICKRLQQNSFTNCVRQYLWKVVKLLWEIRDDENSDVLELVPLKVLERDSKFFKYVVSSNNKIGLNQIRALKKLACFCRNPTLADNRQLQLRTQCLQYWHIPDKLKRTQPKFRMEEFFAKLGIPQDFFMKTPTWINNRELLISVIQNINDWYYCLTTSRETKIGCTFLAGDNFSTAYQFAHRGWSYFPNILLAPQSLMYGELLNEQVETGDEGIRERLSVHVIDALLLGTNKLQELNFHQRHEQIGVYCKSVNRESEVGNSVRIRHKEFRELKDLRLDNRISEKKAKLPLLGYKSLSEEYHIQSIMLINVNHGFSLESVYLIRLSDDDSAFKYLLEIIEELR